MSTLTDRWQGKTVVYNGTTYQVNVQDADIFVSEGFTPNSPTAEYPSDVNSASGDLLVNNEIVATIPTLRKANGVADTYNPVTGELSQKIDPDIDNCTTQSIAEVGGDYVLETPVLVQYTPVVIPTYPRTTVIEQDGEVKGNIIATAKIIDNMGV